MTAQRTLVLLKPDAVQRSLRGEILRRIEAKGYDIVALAQRTATAEAVSYTHLTLPTIALLCISRWSPYH